jgi:putative membrane protein
LLVLLSFWFLDFGRVTYSKGAFNGASTMKQATGGGPLRGAAGYALLCAKGFCMGVADVIPGVSGGTMALILGIYSELIDAIRSFDIKAAKLLVTFRFKGFLDHVEWKFPAAVLAGIFLAVLSVSRLVSWLLVHRPVMIWSFFFGLILASVVSVGKGVGRWSAGRLACFGCAAAGAFLLVGMVPVDSPESFPFLFLCGALAVCAMILPGISGAFILVLLGKYHFVLDAVNQARLGVLAVVAAGACLGLILFSRFLGWLLDHHYSIVLAGLTGLMLGSLRKIWPWKETVSVAGETAGALVQVNTLPAAWNMETAVAVLLMLAGVAAVAGLISLAEVREKAR